MSWTSHDKFLGWTSLFRISKQNAIFGNDGTKNSPFPVIIPNPTLNQVFCNWNAADTGMVVCMTIFGIFAGYRSVHKNLHSSGFYMKKYEFYRYVNMSFGAGIIFGGINSFYRLTGLVPNGLPRALEENDLVKYDYTS